MSNGLETCSSETYVFVSVAYKPSVIYHFPRSAMLTITTIGDKTN